jgi:hypothetical protein
MLTYQSQPKHPRRPWDLAGCIGGSGEHEQPLPPVTGLDRARHLESVRTSNAVMLRDRSMSELSSGLTGFAFVDTVSRSNCWRPKTSKAAGLWAANPTAALARIQPLSSCLIRAGKASNDDASIRHFGQREVIELDGGLARLLCADQKSTTSRGKAEPWRLKERPSGT